MFLKGMIHFVRITLIIVYSEFSKDLITRLRLHLKVINTLEISIYTNFINTNLQSMMIFEGMCNEYLTFCETAEETTKKTAKTKRILILMTSLAKKSNQICNLDFIQFLS